MVRVHDRRSGVSTLGSCPDCGERITSGYELIRYETSDEGRRRYAECPACESVVHPQ